MAINLANNNSLANITALPSSITGGAMTLLATQTASGSANLSFTSGIDSTYDSYVFKFYDMHPATNNAFFQFQADTGTNTSYNQTMTTTAFRAEHYEDNSSAALNYDGGRDQAQGTAFQIISREVGNGNDECTSGELKIFSPSSGTFVKHFIAETNVYANGTNSENRFVAGYFNTTTAITRLQFKMSSGNIDSGVIKLYGIS
jgi:hypothetical protein